MNQDKLTSEFIGWFNPNAAAITIVFNKERLLRSTAQLYMSTLAKRIDERRLGGRWYEKPHADRLHLQAAPELWDEGHPHYHGIIRIPADDLARFGFDGVSEEYAAEFGRVCPGGSLLIKSMDNPEGWVRYCSKEVSLINDDPNQNGKVVWTHSFLSDRAFDT